MAKTPCPSEMTAKPDQPTNQKYICADIECFKCFFFLFIGWSRLVLVGFTPLFGWSRLVFGRSGNIKKGWSVGRVGRFLATWDSIFKNISL
jgi:hypothetical protein